MSSSFLLAHPQRRVYNPGSPVGGEDTVLSQDPGDERGSPAAEPVAAAPVAAAPATPDQPDQVPGEAQPPAEPQPDPLAQAQQRAKLAEDRLAEVLAAYRKLKTDNEGFRERITRDVQRQFERHNQKLVLRFIEVLDNLDRALESAEQAYAGNPLIEGLILVRTQ